MHRTHRQTRHLNTPCSVSVRLVPPEYTAATWPEIAPLVKRMLRRGRGELTASDVFDRLAKGTLDLWIGQRNGKTVACMICETVNYPRLRAYRIFGFAADSLK